MCSRGADASHKKCLMAALLAVERIDEMERRRSGLPLNPKCARAVHGAVDAYHSEIMQRV